MRDNYAEKLIESVIEVLNSERTKQKLSHEKLAASAGIHRTAVSHLENGIRKPSLLVLIKLAKALGLKPSTVLREAEKKLG